MHKKKTKLDEINEDYEWNTGDVECETVESKLVKPFDTAGKVADCKNREFKSSDSVRLRI